MKKIIISFFVFILVFIFTSFAYTEGNWEIVGSPGFSSGGGFWTSLVLDSNDVPYVVYSDSSNNNKATVMKFDGIHWVLVGNAGFSAGMSSNPKIAVDSNNVLYVSYQDYGNSLKATVMKFDGMNWVNVGNAGFSQGVANEISLAIDSNNFPFVSFTDSANNSKLTVMKFDGMNWVYVGNPGFSLDTAWNSSLAIDKNNFPYVSFTDHSNNQKATVMKNVLQNNVPINKFNITYPNGGEIFNAGDNFLATWDSVEIMTSSFPYSDEIYFELVKKDTNVSYLLINSTPNDGKEELTVPSNLESGQYRLHGKIIGTNIEDYSDKTFTIN